MPIVSFVIVNWNATAFLKGCLKAICENVSLPFEVIIVDNASTDTTVEELHSLLSPFRSAKLIVNSANLGYARANNQGIAESSAPFVMLLNPDVLIHRGCVERLVDFLRQNEHVVAVAPRLLYPDGRTQPTCRSFPTPLALLYSSIGLDKLMPRSKVFGRYKMTWWKHDELMEVEQPMASALLIRREALLKLGGFDERFPIFFNDVDLCYRAHKCGMKIYFVPDATATHYHGASTRHLRGRIVVESHISLLRFYSKHYQATMHPIAYAFARAFIMLSFPVRYLVVVLRLLIAT
jgi:GT2 family glycosyltransferase